MRCGWRSGRHRRPSAPHRLCADVAETQDVRAIVMKAVITGPCAIVRTTRMPRNTCGVAYPKGKLRYRFDLSKRVVGLLGCNSWLCRSRPGLLWSSPPRHVELVQGPDGTVCPVSDQQRLRQGTQPSAKRMSESVKGARTAHTLRFGHASLQTSLIRHTLPLSSTSPLDTPSAPAERQVSQGVRVARGGMPGPPELVLPLQEGAGRSPQPHTGAEGLLIETASATAIKAPDQ